MRKAEIIDAVVLECRRQKLKLNTEKAYAGAAGRFFEFSRSCRDLSLGERVGKYLDWMAPRVSGRTQLGALHALAFLCNQVLVATLFCVVYTQLMGIVISMISKAEYSLQNEVSPLRQNDQHRQAVRREDLASEGGGGTREREEGRMAQGQTPQTTDETKTILQALGVTPALADAPVRARNCFTARTRDECILDFTRKIIIQPTGCWLWTGSKQKGDHGLVRFMGKVEKAHRLALLLSTGLTLQTEDFVCHHCDNGWCVNPAHLYVGTHQTNMADRTQRGRTARLTGENGPRASLTQTQVDEIRAKYKPFIYTANMLAAEYGLCATSIKNIIRRKTWKA